MAGNLRDQLAQDVRYAVRSLRNHPGFAAVAILTAALGIGANTSIFSIVDAVLLRPLPYRDAARLVAPTNIGKENFLGLGVGDYQYAAWRDEATILDGIAAYSTRQFTITGNGEPERLPALAATPGYLAVLGVAPAIGRDLTSADAAPRGGQVAVITHSLWMRRFGGDPAILSRQMTLDGKPYSIAGVLPHGFEFPARADTGLLVAFPEPAAQSGGVTYFYSVLARLKPGIAPSRAEADLALINRRLESAYPKKFTGSRAGAQTRVMTLHEQLVGNVRPALLALSGAVALVLLIVCVNVSNLLLARAISRRREIAVRLALGAGRARVLRQLLTEGMLLAGLGAVGGLGIAFAGVRLLRAIAPANVPHVQEAHVGVTVLLFNLAIAVVCGLLFGLAPLRAAAALNPEAALKQTRSAAGGRGQRRLESLLIVAETAFALILLAGAGLLLRTFASLTSIAPGFRPDNVVVAKVSLPYWKYSTGARQSAFRDALLERARLAPEVEAAGAVAALPYAGLMMSSGVHIEGRPRPTTDGEADHAAVNFVAGDYFRALGIPIREGRPISDSDAAGRPAVAVVNDAFARHFFPGASAIGARVRAIGVTEWLEVVGVAGTVKQGGLASEPRLEIWQAAAQSDSGGGAQTIAVRSAADPRVLIPWLRAQILELDRDLPPPEIDTMRARMASLMASQVFVLRLLGLFAGVAILLAAIGIYSVLAYSVERSSHEIGIRMALGAKRSQIMALVLGRGLRLSLAGSVAGIAGGLALTRHLKSLLYGVTPHDPATLAAGGALVVLVALAAAYLPARRAVDQDAAASLRSE
jgi:putative ABC transport system permease protein